jgi:hypothetical protein
MRLPHAAEFKRWTNGGVTHMSESESGNYTFEEFLDDVRHFHTIQMDTAVSQASDIAVDYFRAHYTPFPESIRRMNLFFAARRFIDRHLAELSDYPTGSQGRGVDTQVLRQVFLHYSATSPGEALPDDPTPKHIIRRAMGADSDDAADKTATS